MHRKGPNCKNFKVFTCFSFFFEDPSHNDVDLGAFYMKKKEKRETPHYEVECPDLEDVMIKQEVVPVSKVYEVKAPLISGASDFNDAPDVRELIYQFCDQV